MKPVKMYFLVICMMVEGVHAIPFQGVTCPGNAAIKHPPGASIVLFSEDCKTAYVLPPRVGSISFRAISVTPTAGSCSDVLELGASIAKRAITVLKIEKQQTDIQNECGSSDLEEEACTKRIENLEKRRQIFSSSSMATLSAYQTYGGMHTLSTTGMFVLPWTELIQAYKDLNKGLRVDFQVLPILSTSVQVSPVHQIGIPTLLYMAIPGANVVHLVADKPDGKIAPIGDANIAKREQDWGFVQAFSGTMKLSAAGACTILDDKNPLDTSRIKRSKIASELAINAFIRFPIMVSRSYSAKYNASKILERIEERVSTGWFFSRNEAHKLAESTWSQDTLEINISANDPDFNHPENATRSIRADIMERILRAVATPSAPPGVPELPKQGDLVPWYLRWGYFGFACDYTLGFLQRAVGQRSAVSDFKHKNNQIHMETVDQRRAFERTAVVTFEVEKDGVKDEL